MPLPRFFFRTTSALVCFALCLTSFNCCFIVKQGYYVVKYSASAVSFSKLQKRSNTPEDLRRFILLVNDIRAFAFDSVGLKKNNNYTTYVTVDKKYLVNIVFAAGKDNFTPYQWTFPILGSFPDKGFFDLKDAQAEASKLSKKGYDTYIGRGDAFSTLGFYSDPIYSFMKDFTLFEIASLIIHEETHATLFIKNQVQFNEEMATFIGTQGALRFIAAKFGDTSAQFKSAQNQAQDYTTYIGLIDSLYHRLKTVYDDTKSTANKLQKKKEILDQFKEYVTAKYDSLFLSQNYAGLKKLAINNAFIAADITYTFNLKSFSELYQRKNRNFRLMLASLKALNTTGSDPHEKIGKL